MLVVLEYTHYSVFCVPNLLREAPHAIKLCLAYYTTSVCPEQGFLPDHCNCCCEGRNEEMKMLGILVKSFLKMKMLEYLHTNVLCISNDDKSGIAEFYLWQSQKNALTNCSNMYLYVFMETFHVLL